MSKELEMLSKKKYYDPKQGLWVISLNAVQKALKRNEPMKVINGINYKGQDIMLCPNCERNAGKINDRYCSHCGQALDWTDSE